MSKSGDCEAWLAPATVRQLWLFYDGSGWGAPQTSLLDKVILVNKANIPKKNRPILSKTVAGAHCSATSLYFVCLASYLNMLHNTPLPYTFDSLALLFLNNLWKWVNSCKLQDIESSVLPWQIFQDVGLLYHSICAAVYSHQDGPK